MKSKEITIKNISDIPSFLYHLVPKKFFNKYTNNKDDYDCRNKTEWGNNSSFIHTSPTKKQLKERVADMNWIEYPIKEKFLLLKINTKKINAKFTYAEINGFIYHHIWGYLPKASYTVSNVNRSQDGKFLF